MYIRSDVFLFSFLKYVDIIYEIDTSVQRNQEIYTVHDWSLRRTMLNFVIIHFFFLERKPTLSNPF